VLLRCAAGASASGDGPRASLTHALTISMPIGRHWPRAEESPRGRSSWRGTAHAADAAAGGSDKSRRAIGLQVAGSVILHI
jgi:hypothetical protein